MVVCLVGLPCGSASVAHMVGLECGSSTRMVLVGLRCGNALGWVWKMVVVQWWV